MDSIADFRETLLTRRNVDPSIQDVPGTTVVADEGRNGSDVASAYVFGSHLVVFSNPDLADRLEPFNASPFERDTQSPIDEFAAWAVEAGMEFLGTGAMRVLPAPIRNAPTDSALPIVALDRDRPEDVARLTEFADTCDPDDVEQAAIEFDDLDPVIRCIEGSPGGPIVAYGSALPEDDFGGRFDIGVLTHPDHRKQGLGRLVVSRVANDLLAQGDVPIYRHELKNVGSAALAESLGFIVATRLIAVRIPD